MRTLPHAVLSFTLSFCLAYQTLAQTVEGAQPSPVETSAPHTVELVKKPTDAIELPAGTNLGSAESPAGANKPVSFLGNREPEAAEPKWDFSVSRNVASERKMFADVNIVAM